MNIAIITGASSGLGREFAKQVGNVFSKIDVIWLVARRKDRLEELGRELDKPIKVIPLDLTEEMGLDVFQELLQQENPAIRILINCAGFGMMGDFKDGEYAEQLGMIDLNCKALTALTHMCIPYMKKNSRIIQLASSAAFMPQPGFAVYAASKSFVLSFSRALGAELRKQHIYVTAVCPGPVATEFFQIAEKRGSTLLIKKMTMVLPQEVVKAALWACYKKKSVTVYSLWIQLFRVLTKMVPHTILVNLSSLVK